MTSDTPPEAGREWDRAAAERSVSGLVEGLRAERSTRVLALHGDRVPLAGDVLAWGRPDDIRPEAEWAFLGRDRAGRGVLLAAVPAGGSAPVDAAAWAGLRDAGARLPDGETGVLVEALSLGRWLLDAAHCPFCGARCVLGQAGWSRHCPRCGREHFPRTDPAVIVAVTDAAGERLLLGAARAWGGAMYSTFAGFVEAGESLEDAARRELLEEAGVVLDDIRYHASQAWPSPRSLMVGFHAVASGEARPDGDEIVAVRWFSRAEIVDALEGRGGVSLPGPSSIARALIVDWLAA